MGQHSEAELNCKFIETAKLMNIYLNHFPKFEKYALAQEIRVCMYEVYSLMVESQKRYHKKTALGNLDVRHEQWRMLVNLANSLGYFQFKDGKEADRAPGPAAASCVVTAFTPTANPSSVATWTASCPAWATPAVPILCNTCCTP